VKQAFHTATKKHLRILRLLLVASLTLFAANAKALVLTPYFESVLVPSVSTSWTTVALDNNYANAIPVCTYVLGTFAGSPGAYTNVPAVTRIRNITASSFQLRIQGWEDGPASTSDVHCMVMDEGAHTLPDGRLVEAHSVVSDETSGQFSTDGGWDQSILEDVSSTIVHTYSDPVVVGQVMSYNDSKASVIYMSDCDNRANEPFHAGMADGICVGKHIGMIPGSRASETIGYIVGETGSGTINNVFYELAMGPDSVAGNNGGNNGNSYTGLARHHTMAVLSQAAEDGGNGSWAVLYGATPLTNGAMELVVDEEVFAGDTSRGHTRERVYYWAFAGGEITLVKNLINDSGGTATLSDFNLTAVGPDTIVGTSGTPAVTKAVVTPGTYTVSETTVTGYTASAWECSGASKFSGSDILVVGGDHVTCKITNDDDALSTLTLAKVVNNSFGGTATDGDFTLSFNGEGVTGSGVVGAASVTGVTVPAGDYTLSEILVQGYELEGIKCDGTDSDGSDGLKINPGEKVTCTFINADNGVDLTIKKLASNTSPNIGDILTFMLNVTNNGPDTATAVQILDPVTAGFSYVASSMTGGDVQDDSSPTGTGLEWTINTLSAGATVTLMFKATVLPP